MEEKYYGSKNFDGWKYYDGFNLTDAEDSTPQ